MNQIQHIKYQKKKNFTQEDYEKIKEQIDSSNQNDLKKILHQENFDVKILEKFENFDFDRFQEYYETYKKNPQREYKNFVPLREDEIQSLQEIDPKEYKDLYQKGVELIRNKKTALILLAGGDGKRLKCELPKLMYEIQLREAKTLTEVFIKRVQSLLDSIGQEQEVPIYFIISSQMGSQILQFFKENQNFGYQNLIFYETSRVINVFDDFGQILIDKDCKPIKTSLGNGDLTSCLNRGLLDHMRSNQIEYVNVSNIDNLLFKPLDPILFGYLQKYQQDIVFKTIEKIDPQENVGIHGKSDRGYDIYEYFYLTKDQQEMREGNGLKYRYANIMNFSIMLDSLETIANMEKQMNHLNFVEREFEVLKNEKVQKVKAIKVERFFMDFFPFLKKQSFLLVDREFEFAPIKSVEGMNTPESAYKALSKMNQKILNKKYEDDQLVEIPLEFTFKMEEFEQLSEEEKEKLVQISFIKQSQKQKLKNQKKQQCKIPIQENSPILMIFSNVLS